MRAAKVCEKLMEHIAISDKIRYNEKEIKRRREKYGSAETGGFHEFV